MTRVLVTGGAGYIGSHTCVELVSRGYQPVIVDNFVNSSPKAINRICQLTNSPRGMVRGRCPRHGRIAEILSKHECEAVIHFAGLKAVGESTEKPLEYYSANVTGTHSLIQAMLEAGAARSCFHPARPYMASRNSCPIQNLTG
jgi:UDP-glucose 4-epimerase